MSTSGAEIAVALAGTGAVVRTAGPPDGVGGVEPVCVASPGTVAQAAGVLQAATALDMAVVARGSGRTISWGLPPTRCDVIADLGAKGISLHDVTEQLVADGVKSFAQSFKEMLDTIIRELLETVISTQYFAIALEEVRPSFHIGRLDSGKIDEKTTFYLAVSADMPALDLEVV